MSGFKLNKSRSTSRVPAGRSIGRVSRTVGTSSHRRRSSGMLGSSKPRRRLLEGVDQRKLARVLTVVAFLAVGIIGIWIIVLSANSGGQGITISTLPDAETDNVIVIGESGDIGGTATIAIGGSIKLQDSIISAAAACDNQFGNYLSDLDVLMSADISIVNLLGTVDGYKDNKNIDGFSNGNYPKELAASLSQIGVNYVSTANSQSLIGGLEALENSEKNLAAQGIESLGTFAQSQSANKFTVKEVNGIVVGIGAYNCLPKSEINKLKAAQREKGMTDEQIESVINQLSTDTLNPGEGKSKSEASNRIVSDVEKMREQGAQYIIVLINWQDSDGNRPNIAQRMVDAGVDLTIGYGADTLGDIRTLEHTDADGNKKRCYVYYNLGNLFSDCDSGKTASKYRSMSLSITLSRSAGSSKVTVSSNCYNPIYINCDTFYNDNSTHLKYRVVPVAMYVKTSADDIRPDIFREDEQWEKCTSAFTSVRSLVENSRNNLKDYLIMGTITHASADGSAYGGDAGSTQL